MYKHYRHFSYRDKEIYEGGIYHITQRAPGQERLFHEDGDYLDFLQLLKKRTEDFKLDTFCFCLMPNHVHILLRINKPNLSEAMKSLFTAYAVRFNKKYKRKGHVFSGVYRASPCIDDAHLIAASLYIHLNPQKAKMVEDALNYRWSSIRPYTNFQIKSFINKEFILKIINEDLRKAASLYKIMLKENSNLHYGNIIEEPKAVIEFAKSSLEKMLEIVKDRSINKDFIYSEKMTDVTIDKFKNRDKIHIGSDKEKRELFALVKQLKSQGISLTDISNKVSVSRKVLYQILEQKI